MLRKLVVPGGLRGCILLRQVITSWDSLPEDNDPVEELRFEI